MHVAILFSCQQIYSVERKSILLTVPFSWLCGDIIQIPERALRHRSRAPVWHLSRAPSPTAATQYQAELPPSLVLGAWTVVLVLDVSGTQARASLI